MTASQSTGPAVVTAPAPDAAPDQAAGPVTTSREGRAVSSGEADTRPSLADLTVIGVDLSLRSTGIAGPDWSERIVPPSTHDGLRRLRWIRCTVADHARGKDVALIEGPSYGSVGRGQHERGGLWWMTYEKLQHTLGLVVVVVPPTVIKKYACGKGTADKEDVTAAAIRRLPWFTGKNDEADAAWLAQIGVDRYHGRAVVPESHRAVLESIDWPEVL